MGTENNAELNSYCLGALVAKTRPSAQPAPRPRRLYEWLHELAGIVDPQSEAADHRSSHSHAIGWYHRDLAWQARIAQTEQVQRGWWTGRAPYGYQRHTCRIRDPRASGRRRTVRRHYLSVDEARADVVAEVFGWYVADRLGPTAIATRLTAEPDHYPPPVDPAAGTERAWTAAAVRTVLDHPAYLGYTVCGRTRHGQPIPTGLWTWSPGPTHPALVGLDLWWAAHHRLHPATTDDGTAQIAETEEAA